MNYVNDTLALANKGLGHAAESVRKRHLIAKSLLIGIVAGGVGVAFRMGPDWIHKQTEGLRGWVRAGGTWELAQYLVISAGLGGLAVWLVKRFAPEAAGGGMPHLRACLARETEFRWARVLWVKVCSLFLGVAGGLGLGAEAPAIHSGGACGQGLAYLFRAPRGIGEHRAMISAGAAAGLSAAFNAPLAGVIFVLEELQGNFSTPVLVCTVLASATADVVTRMAIGHPPVFHMHGVICPTGFGPILGAALIGLLAGLVGALFNRWVVACAKLAAGRFSDWRIGIGAFGAALTAYLSLHFIGLDGGGVSLVELSLNTETAPVAMLVTLMVLRFGATLTATASGAAGGFMIPLLALGALAGRAIAGPWNVALPDYAVPAGIFVAVGMGAFFASSVRAPLTGLVLILELTGDYGFMLPALIACIIAFLVGEELGVAPVYHALGGTAHKPDDATENPS